MNRPIDEIRRLREQVAEKTAQLSELRSLIAKHFDVTKDDDKIALQREREAFEHGEKSGADQGFRRGVEHALIAAEDAHLARSAHDVHGQPRELGLHNGPVPPVKTADEIVADAEAYQERWADWWWRESQRDQPRPIQPKAPDRELEAG